MPKPATLTGSIGVVMMKFVIDGTLKKLWHQQVAGEAGALRRHLFPGAAVHAGRAREDRQEQMQATYDTFVEKAAAGRARRPKRLTVAQGRVWTGLQASRFGLVRRARRARARAPARQGSGQRSAGTRNRTAGLSAEAVHLRHFCPLVRRGHRNLMSTACGQLTGQLSQGGRRSSPCGQHAPPLPSRRSL